ncbi:MAG: chromosome partitioning protein ParB [Alphaproteobacteria bacterium]|nr:chromosome partitioning protein ParB [Alphaproteobacteria bacterium]
MPKKTAEAQDIKIGFETDTVRVPLSKITPLKLIAQTVRESEKFQQIVASIREVGVIEPPVVAPKKKTSDPYLLLDGHLRIEALKILGESDVTCLVSTDDEAFTYNKHISRLSPIQEHRMILEAIKRGVSEAKIARALNLNVANIVRKRNLLDGICPEAVDLLKDKMVAGNSFNALRRMKATRQIEAATLMNDAGIYSVSYVNALLAATPQSMLLNPTAPKKVKGLSEDQMARMEAEMESLHGEYRLIEDSHGTNVLNLTVARSYLASLLENQRVSKYLGNHHPEFLSQFKKITAMVSLGGETEQ